MSLLTALVNLSVFIYAYVASIVGDMWDGLSTLLPDVIDFFVSLFEGVVKVFYNAEATGDKITVIGWFTLVGIAVGMFWMGLRFIRKLIHNIRAR